MKVFILTTVMAPYRVQLFNEIGKHCELYVCFEQMHSFERNDKWYDKDFSDFNFVELKKWDESVSKIKWEVIKHIRNIRPDVVIAYEYSTNTSLVLMSYCQLTGIPYIINCDGAFVTKSIKDIVKRFYISRAKGFISSGNMADKYLLHYGASAERIYHNHFTSLHKCDIIESVPSNEEKKSIRARIGIGEEKMVLSVGQFIHRKGYDILLKAMADFPDDVGVYIVGGQATAEYEQIVGELNLKNIHFLDFMPMEELRDYYQAADLFVLPTREDVWGLVVNEAMGCGLPVVTTDRCVAGIEMIKDGINGYIVPSENHKMLCDAMHTIISDEALKNSMSEANLNIVSDYTYESSAKDIMSAIENVCQESR